jgi:hypothetical protein
LIYAFLGDSREATRALDTVLSESFPNPGGAGGQVNLRLVRTLTRVRDGDVEDGLAEAITVMEGYPHITPHRRLIIGQVIEAIPKQAQASPAARELKALTAA